MVNFWEQVEFGQLGIISRGLTYRPNDVTDKNGVRVLRSSNIHEDSFVLNNNDVFVNSSTVKIHNVKNGDILVTSANGSSRLVGKHAIIKGLSNKTVHGGFMLAIRPATNSYFLNSLMNTSWYDNFISTFVSGGNGSIGNLKKSDLERQDIFIPLKQEQNKIGDIFYNLERTITLHEEQHRQLERLKKALLQKMFADETGYPALRFKGFTEKWEQSYLKDIASVNSGRDYKHLNKGNIPVYGTGGYMLSVDKALSNTKDGIGIGRKGTINNPYILKAPFWTVDTLFYVIPYNVDLNFLYGIFQKIDWRKKDESTGVPSLSKENINKTKFKIPAISEQKEIGTIFQNLDTLITLHQHKIDNLKRLKRALLQKMFV